MLAITKENYDVEVAKADGLVVIDFWAEWCGPCRMLAPVFQEASEELTSVKFCKVNVDEQPELTRKFGVSSIPMLAVMKDGNVLTTLVGYRTKDMLVAELSEYVEE
ncbi:MAG: thioredoxin [Clostridia bacterium]|nr:thioredoxin [Clostridia bacterium]